MKRARTERKAPSTAADRLQAGRRELTVGDLRTLAAMGEGVDLDGLARAMAEADALISDYKKLRPHLAAIDAALALDPDNLPARRPKSPAERRRQWQEQERALREAACRSMNATLPLVRAPSPISECRPDPHRCTSPDDDVGSLPP